MPAAALPRHNPLLKVDEKIANLGKAGRIWAVGSVYGRYGALCQLHEALTRRLQPSDRLVYLGNYLGAHSQWTGEGQALLSELIAFRDALAGQAAPENVVLLRGGFEDLALKLSHITFYKNPVAWVEDALPRGLEFYLSAYGITAAQLLAAAQTSVFALNRFVQEWQKLRSRQPGHGEFLSQLRMAAQTHSSRPLAFIPSGLDPRLPLYLQNELLCWPESDITALGRYSPYARVIRGTGGRTAVLEDNGFVVTLDGGSGLDGMIHAACFDPQGRVIEHFTF